MTTKLVKALKLKFFILLLAGGQTTISIDIHRRYPRSYIHRHHLQTARTRPHGFAQQGPSEIYHFVNDISTMVKGYKDSDGRPATVLICNRAHTTKSPQSYLVPMKQIFQKPPHFTTDNHFSGDNVMEFIGERGFGITMTCRRDRLPAGLKQYLHHEKKEGSDPRQKVMKYHQPIVAIKQVPAPATTDPVTAMIDPALAPATATAPAPVMAAATTKKAYTMTLVSFQSTSSTNITGVNNLPSLSLYVDERSRGRKGNMRRWGIEMNEARETYLRHYSGIDSADHMIKNTGIRYVTWKYWHAPYLHALSLGVIACYDMYIECCEGGLDPEWKVKKEERMSFSTFRFLLSKQMMGYNPSNNYYSGDDKFRESTRKHKKRRVSAEEESRDSFPDTGVTMDNLRLARQNGRICDTIDDIQTHFVAIVNTNNASTCEVCGRKCYWKCGRCGKFMCATQGRKWHGAECAFLYHKEGFFGLSRSDWEEVQGRKDASQKWSPPTEERIARNARAIERMKARK